MRYRSVKLSDHPLAGPDGWILEHRAILYEKLGPGAQECHWCGRVLHWAPTEPTRGDRLCTDHLDTDSANNAPNNLVASCRNCNGLRNGPRIREGEPHKVRANGSRSRGKIRICVRCGVSFVAWNVRDPQRGRYCSRNCVPTGRKPGGAGLRVLTEDAVQAIRAAYAAGGISQMALSAKYGVAQMTISKLLTGKTWTHLA